MLENAQIAPNFDFGNPNSRISMEKLNVYISTKLIPFPGKGFRRASVNAFGYGGTNGHAILDDAEGYLRSHGLFHHLHQVPSAKYQHKINGSNGINGNQPEQNSHPRVYLFSGKTSRALQARKKDIAAYLEASSHKDSILDSLAYTLNCRRTHFLHRDFLVASSFKDFMGAMGLSSKTSLPASPDETSTMSFCFTGQGAQWAGMGKELIDAYPVFRQALEQCQEAMRECGAKWSLIAEMRKESDSRIHEAEMSQPLCTALQIAVFQLLATWDIHPQAVFGHSSGEIAAAYASGILSLKDAMEISYYRGFWCSKMKKVAPQYHGAMLAVGLSEEAALPHLDAVPVELGKAVVACVNSPSSVTVSGDAAAVESLVITLTECGVFARKLRVDTAYHSYHMEKVSENYRSALISVKPRPISSAKFFSSVTGLDLDSPSSLDGDYWVSNMVSQVKFMQAVQSFAADLAACGKSQFSNNIVEIGPHSALSGPLRETLNSPSTPKITSIYLSSILRQKSGIESLLSLAGNAFTKGCPLNYEALNPKSHLNARVLVDLPKYPWDHSSTYWYESRISSDYRLRTRPKHPLLGASSMDWNPLKPSWRNIIRMAELPWVKGHGIQSEILYPAGGFLAAVLQACNEYNIMQVPDRKVRQFVLEDVDITKALIIPEGLEGVEMKTELEPLSTFDASSTRFKFLIHSCTADKVWSKNCSGFAKIVHRLEIVPEKNNSLEEIREFDEVQRQLPTWVRRTRSTLYEDLQGLGYFYEEPFQGIEEVFTEPNRSLGKVVVPDTSKFMPKEYELPLIAHPATIDSFLQTPLCALFEADALLTTMVPTHVGSLTVSGAMLHKPGDRLSVLAQASMKGPRKCHVGFRVRSGDGEHTELVVGKGLQYSSLGKAGVPGESKNLSSLCNRFVCQPGTMILTGDAFRQLVSDGNSVDAKATGRTGTLESASAQYINHTVNVLEDWKPDDNTPPYRLKLYGWLKSHTKPELPNRIAGGEATNGTNGMVKHNLDKSLGRFGATGELIARIGPHLAEIVKGTQSPMKLLEPNFQTCYSSMQKYLDILKHEKSNLKVLEYGNLVGQPCKPALEALEGACTVYDFASSPSAFLLDETPATVETDIPVKFKKLDIEDPISQGYEESSYDVIIAMNTLHAAKSIRKALKSLRLLLNPGGSLLVVDVVDPKIYVNMLFGTIPGWWQAEEEDRCENPTFNKQQWDAAMKEAQFSGAKLCTEETGPYGLIATQAVWPADKDHARVSLVAQSNTSQLAETLEHETGLQVKSSRLIDIRSKPGVVVVLDDGPVSIFERMTSADFEAVKTIVGSAEGIVWITRGPTTELPLPSHSSMVVGLARVVRSENPILPFVTVEIDSAERSYESRRAASATAMVRHVQNMTKGRRTGDEDMEFFEKNGVLCVTRLLDHDRAGLYASEVVVENQSHMDQFNIGKSLKKLDVSAPGNVGSVCWVDQGLDPPSPGPDEVVIEAKAFGLNPMDLSIALGRSGSASDMSGAFSGIVCAVGAECKDRFQPQDIVCGWTAAGFSSYPVAKASAVRKTSLAIPSAAAIPVAYPMVTYSLLHLARLKEGESILIHNATGVFGEVAFQLAKHIGAIIFISLDSSLPVEIASKKFDIPASKIISSDVVGSVKALTGGHGVDVLINLSNGDGVDILACMAPFGRVVDVSPAEEARPSSRNVRSHEKSLTSFSLDMATVLKHRPQLYGQQLDEALKLITHGVLKVTAEEHPLEDLTQALRLMQKRDTGNHVLIVEGGAKVPVSVKFPISNHWDFNVSYPSDQGAFSGDEACLHIADHQTFACSEVLARGHLCYRWWPRWSRPGRSNLDAQPWSTKHRHLVTFDSAPRITRVSVA